MRRILFWDHTIAWAWTHRKSRRSRWLFNPGEFCPSVSFDIPLSKLKYVKQSNDPHSLLHCHKIIRTDTLSSIHIQSLLCWSEKYRQVCSAKTWNTLQIRVHGALPCNHPWDEQCKGSRRKRLYLESPRWEKLKTQSQLWAAPPRNLPNEATNETEQSIFQGLQIRNLDLYRPKNVHLQIHLEKERILQQRLRGYYNRKMTMYAPWVWQQNDKIWLNICISCHLMSWHKISLFAPSFGVLQLSLAFTSQYIYVLKYKIQ